MGKGRKKEKEQRKKKKKGDGIRTAELDRRDQVTATNSWPNFPFKEGSKADNQVAAPTESSTPNFHRATIAQQRVRMEGLRQRRHCNGNNLAKEEIKKKKEKKRQKMKEEP